MWLAQDDKRKEFGVELTNEERGSSFFQDCEADGERQAICKPLKLCEGRGWSYLTDSIGVKRV